MKVKYIDFEGNKLLNHLNPDLENGVPDLHRIKNFCYQFENNIILNLDN